MTPGRFVIAAREIRDNGAPDVGTRRLFIFSGGNTGFSHGHISNGLSLVRTSQTPGNPAPGPLTAAPGGPLASPAGSSGSTGRRRADFGGSHGSLDALASGPERESFFALLRDLGAQSSSGSSTNGNGSLVPSRSSPERDLDDPVHAKPVGCAPSRLAELLKPNFSGSARLPEPSFTFVQPQPVAR